MTLRITQAVEADLPDLLALYRHLSPADPPPDPDQAMAAFRRFHLYVGSAILLGRVQDHAVTTGTLIVVPNLTRQVQPYALIENVVTLAAFRHQG